MNCYLHVRDAAKAYGMTPQALYRIRDKIAGLDRYKSAWTEINSGGHLMINTLVLEDYLRYRTELDNPNLARKLPPYDPAVVRWNRGEYEERKNERL